MKPKSLNIYMAPTRQQAKDIMWQPLKDRFLELGWEHESNETELKLTRANGSIIQLRSAEKPGRLRGLGLDLITPDEFAEYKNGLKMWNQDIRPALSDKLGKAIFTMTPKGFNDGYKIFNNAKTKTNWASFTHKTIDSPFFQTPEGIAELKEAREDLNEKDFRQEYEASFENFSGRIYYSFDRAKCHSDVVYDPSLPIYVGQDFNRSPMSSCVFQKVSGVFIQIAEIFLMSSNTDEVCYLLKQRYPRSNVIMRPDATGVRQTSNSSLSDHNIIRNHGFSIQCGNGNPRRVDRWAAVNRAFEKNYVKINTKTCPKTTEDLELICYKEGSCEPMLNDPYLGHLADAFGYAVNWEFPILGKVTVSRYA